MRRSPARPWAACSIQALTAPYAILVDALSFLWSASWVGAIRSRAPKPERAPTATWAGRSTKGLAFVLGNRLLRSIAACTGTSNLFSNVGLPGVLRAACRAS